MSGTKSVTPKAPATDETAAPDWGPLSTLPGNPMMWILILGELAVFGALFTGFAVSRALDPVTFDASQAQLDRLLGGLNTIVLVTSGWLAAVAVRRKQAGRSPRPHLLAAIAVGSLFLAVKVVEYRADFALGIDMDTNSFWELYFLLTGFHALHVVMGLIVLAIVTLWDSLENLETGTAFWHMVDLIWVLLYPLVYLLR
jgi:nitric oxide reductase NorE protein